MKNVKLLSQEILEGHHDDRLLDIYIRPERVEREKKRLVSAIAEFTALYGEQEAEIYSAPGRSEIGGNHTDHQRDIYGNSH